MLCLSFAILLYSSLIIFAFLSRIVSPILLSCPRRLQVGVVILLLVQCQPVKSFETVTVMEINLTEKVLKKNGMVGKKG